MLHGRYDCGAYTRLQFLRSVSHSVGAHSSRLCDFVEDGSDDDADVAATDSPSNSQTDSQVVDTPQTNDDNCEVCLIAPRNPRVALVPCGHQRFCIDCANCVHDQGRGCPICRSDITIVLTLYWHSANCTELNCRTVDEFRW